MDPFRVGHARGTGWREVADACVAQLGAVDDAPACLGFLYATDVFVGELTEILERFKERTGVARWVGAVGQGICASGVEYHDTGALVAMVGAFPGDGFRVFEPVVEGFDGFEAAHREWCRRNEPHFGVVHATPCHGALPSLVASLSERLGGGFLVGGLASSATRELHIADAVAEAGLSGVLFSRDVAVSTRLTQGCTPIGPRREVTRSERNIVVELDGRPALDVFKEDIGEVLARNLARVGGYIFAGLPVRGSDTGDYLVRNLLGVDPTHKVIAVGDRVTEGSQLVFCRRDAQSARADLQRMLGEIRRSLPGPPRGGVYFTCLGRGPHLFGEESAELGIIAAELGEVPLAGFYANGEISHDRLYGYTGVLALFA